MNKQKNNLLQIWGGIECSINRVNDRYLDQLDLAGTYGQPAQLDAIISLGIQTIRFPVLWEKQQPAKDTVIDWTWAAESLHKLRENNITVIAGLLHHGSGPSYTNLLQDDFPDLFAAYAAKVATQFPWIENYTPVNEPLTTARFSGLYGLWYPHKKNDVSFIKILLNELKASVLAMQAIREINPAAKFIQTEDLGKTYSTHILSYQANFENQRRWLTCDILCGRFNETHTLWEHVMRLGISRQTLQFFVDNPCPPDMIGVNHYITSERYLDEDIQHYPVETIGGNSLHRYADVEAVRVQVNQPHGLEHLLHETWDRYKIPIVITEAHLHCTREEQLRWINYVYETAVKLKKDGVDIRAVTAWALLGSFGWNKLLTCHPCEYETGAFDISAGYPRPTAIAAFIKNGFGQGNFSRPLLMQPGWWKLNSRLYKKTRAPEIHKTNLSVQPLIIIGKTGTLGQAFSRICTARNIHHFLVGRNETDITNPFQVEMMINRYHPWAIINAAGYVKVDEAETEAELCYKENYTAVQNLTLLSKQYGIRLLSFSTDLVFDGKKNGAYVETDPTDPLNVYGHSKQLAEIFMTEKYAGPLVIRTAAFFSPWDEHNFVSNLLATLRSGNKFIAADDQIVSPTYVPHLVHASLDLLMDDASGIWHLTNKDSLSWYQFAKKIAAQAGLDSSRVMPGYNMPGRARRPGNSALNSNRYQQMPSLDEAIKSYCSSPEILNENINAKNIVHERI